MKQKPWKPYLFWILFTEAVGGLSGWLTMEGNERFQETAQQPPLSPPGWVFGLVWGILFALMGFSAARIWRSAPSPEQKKSINLFLIQLTVNFFWSLIFFNLRAYGFALLWLGLLWVLILWMIFAFRQTDRLSAWLQLPYLLWVSFAAYLNWGVWVLN